MTGCERAKLHATFQVVLFFAHLRKRLRRNRSRKALHPPPPSANDDESSDLDDEDSRKQDRLNRSSTNKGDYSYVERVLGAYGTNVKLDHDDTAPEKIGVMVRSMTERGKGMLGRLDLLGIATDDNKLVKHTERPAIILSMNDWFQKLFKTQDCLCLVQLLQNKTELVDGLDCKTLANLEYLLLRYRQMLMQKDLLMHVMHHLFDRFISQPLKDSLKYGGEKWCSEYSCGKPPASTTWPWSIKPSLAVLWGVCWQFFDAAPNLLAFGGQRQLRLGRPQGRDERPDLINNRSGYNSSTAASPHAGFSGYQSSPSTLRHPWHETPQPFHRHQQQPLQQSPSFLPSSEFFNSHNNFGLGSPDQYGVHNNSNRHPQQVWLNWNGLQGTTNCFLAASPPNASSSPGTPASISLATRTEAISSGHSPSLPQFPSRYQFSQFPARMSDVETLANSTTAQDVAQTALATAGDLTHRSMDDVQMDSPPFEPFSPRRGNTHKRSEEPPKNPHGKFVCKHAQTSCPNLTFDRKCEWSKHMDKHERPYKCEESGCEKLQGFTYSGGLLRHQREVHKMHGGTKETLHCPHENCKRHSGSGFTRRENLTEHIRRVHRRNTDITDITNASKRSYDDLDTTDPALEEVTIRSDHIIGDENIDPNVLASQGNQSPTKRRRYTGSNGVSPTESASEISELRMAIQTLTQKFTESHKFLIQQNDNLRKDLHAVQDRLNKVENQYARRLLEE